VRILATRKLRELQDQQCTSLIATAEAMNAKQTSTVIAWSVKMRITFIREIIMSKMDELANKIRQETEEEKEGNKLVVRNRKKFEGEIENLQKEVVAWLTPLLNRGPDAVTKTTKKVQDYIGDYNAPGFSVKLVGGRAVEVIPIGWNGTGTKGSIEIVNITPHGRGIFEIVLLESGWSIFEAAGQRLPKPIILTSDSLAELLDGKII
jgi:hypothetical protein